MKKLRAVFLDLNGTIVLPMKQETLEEMHLIPGAEKAIRRLLAAGFVCPVITIQSRIEKGLFTEQEFRTWFVDFFRRHELDVKGPYVCPHRYNHPCPCKKPSPLLYERAAQDLDIDLPKSYVIGDSPEDVRAAKAFGGTACLVRTGWAAAESVVENIRSRADYVALSIVEAVDWILAKERNPPAVKLPKT
jgi:D-glycero-D-manno-heptose 1,7-bisphosphate phosphatase